MKNGAILNYNCYRILNTTKFKLRIIGRFIKVVINYNLCFLHSVSIHQVYTLYVHKINK